MDNDLLNKPITYAQKISSYDNTTILINFKISLRWMYLNKMIAKNMSNTYYAMHRRIYWWLTSKRRKRHALLQRQRYKNYIIPWSNDISHVGDIHIHLSIVTCMNQVHRWHLVKVNSKQKQNINYIPWIIHQQVETSLIPQICLYHQKGWYTHQAIGQVL